MQRYFVNKNQVNNNVITINGDDFHHISKVMRMKENDKVIVSNNETSWLCEISLFNNNEVLLNIIEELKEEKELPVSVTIAHGVVRREKLEEVIDKIHTLKSKQKYSSEEISEAYAYIEQLSSKAKLQ